MGSKVALITGVTGQSGSYLSELLLSKGYTVHGTRRPSSGNTMRNIEGLPIELHHCDLTDPINVLSILKKVKPDEVYNLAAISHVKISFDMPDYSFNVNAVAVLNILSGIRLLDLDCKVYQASTSELYGKVRQTPQTETTPFYPRSPYAIAKQFAYWTVVNYREAYNMFACNGILFNHESPRRGEAFVTRKITQGVARIVTGNQKVLRLGNLDATRDWGHAKDYVRAMWLMMQADTPDDYVVATGITTSIREFITMAFLIVGHNITFRGEGIEEVGVIEGDRVVLTIDPKYYRPTEVQALLGDASKARDKLGWECEYNLEKLVYEMLENDLRNEKYV